MALRFTIALLASLATVCAASAQNTNWTACQGCTLTVTVPQGTSQINVTVPQSGSGPTLVGPLTQSEPLIDTTPSGQASGGVTYSGVNFGAPDPSRVLVIAMGYRTGTTTADVTSITVGGVAATKQCEGVNSAAYNGYVGYTYPQFWTVPLPTGSSGNIIVTYGASLDHASGMNVYAAYGLNSATAVACANSNSPTAPSLTLNVNAGGIVIAEAWSMFIPTQPTTSWSANLTNDSEIITDTNGGNQILAFAHATGLAAGTQTFVGTHPSASQFQPEAAAISLR